MLSAFLILWNQRMVLFGKSKKESEAGKSTWATGKKYHNCHINMSIIGKIRFIIGGYFFKMITFVV
jgi:hypothetical protein